MNAKLYLKYNNLQKTLNAKIFKDYSRLFNFKNNENIFEVGCGVGQSTQDFIKCIPAKYKFNKFVAVDKSTDMIEYANKDAISSVQYLQMDIEKPDISPEFQGEFDRVFSLFVLHWVNTEHQLQAFQNINSLLKKDGSFFAIFVACAPSYKVYMEMNKSTKWSKYWQHPNEFLSPYNSSVKGVNEKLWSILKESNFDTPFFERRRLTYYFKDHDEFLNTVKAIHPFMCRMPAELHEEYWNEAFKVYDNICDVRKTGAFPTDAIIINSKKI